MMLGWRRGLALTLVLCGFARQTYANSCRPDLEKGVAAAHDEFIFDDLSAIHRQLNLKSSVHFLRQDPEIRPTLARLERIFSSLTEEMLSKLRYQSRHFRSAAEYQEAYTHLDLWDAEDFETLKVLLDGAPLAPTHAQLDANGGLTQEILSERRRRIRAMVTHDLYRHGIQLFLLRPEIQTYMAQTPNMFPSLFDPILGNFNLGIYGPYRAERLQLDYDLLNPAPTRITRAGIKDPDAIEVYLQAMNYAVAYLLHTLPSYQRGMSLQPDTTGKTRLHRQFFLGSVAPKITESASLIETLDTFVFGTSAPMTTRETLDLLLNNARKLTPRWKSRFNDYLREEARNSKPAPVEPAAKLPVNYSTQDFFAPRGGMRPLRGKAKPELVHPDAATEENLPQGEELGDPDTRSIFTLEENKIYLFRQRRLETQGVRRAQFGPKALKKFKENPKLARGFLRALIMGPTTSGSAKYGSREFYKKDKSCMELKVPESFRATMRLYAGIYQVIDVVKKDDIHKPGTCFGPLPVPSSANKG